MNYYTYICKRIKEVIYTANSKTYIMKNFFQRKAPQYYYAVIVAAYFLTQFLR